MKYYRDARFDNQWRPSTFIRIVKHSLEYGVAFALFPLNKYYFFSEFSLSKMLILKTAKQLATRSTIGLAFFSLNELFFMKIKPTYYSFTNLLATFTIIPLIYKLKSKNIVQACRIALVLSVFSMFHDLSIQLQRSILLQNQQKINSNENKVIKQQI